MPCTPSPRIEKIVAALVPPASREHLLGDLAECANTPRQYFTALAVVLPTVVFSQVVRKIRAGSGLGLMAALSAATFAVAALVTSPHPSTLPVEWARWPAPWITWTLGCALAAAYGPAGTRLWSGWGVLAALAAAIGVAALSGLHVPAAVGALLVATAAHMALTLPRLGDDLARVVAAAPGTPLSLDNLSERAHKFQRTIWWRNARESAAAVLLLAMNANTLATTRPDSAAGWAAPVLGVAGLACLLYALHVKAGSRRVPAGRDRLELLRFHQAEIARQRQMLLAVPYWYLLPLVPGMVAQVIATWKPASPVALAVMAAVFVGVACLNRLGARWLDSQLAEARALEAGART